VKYSVPDALTLR